MFSVQNMPVEVENFKRGEPWILLIEMCRDLSLLRVRGAKIYAA